jgi:hypothetical protein
MIELEGIINNQPISIWIDSGANHGYVNPEIVEKLN